MGDVPLDGCVYFVDSAIGNDGWDGRSRFFEGGNAGPWKTIAKVNATVTRTSADVCLMDNSDFSETLVVDWSGLSDNQARVEGCYFDTADSTVRKYDGGSGAGRNAKPIVDGYSISGTNALVTNIVDRAEHIIATTDTAFNCFDEGVVDGDTIWFAAGTHPRTNILCSMADGENVTFTNEPSGQAVFSGGGTNWVVTLLRDRSGQNGPSNFTIDGSDGYDGMPNGAYCGSRFPGDTGGTDGCGIVVFHTSGAAALMRGRDVGRNYTLKGIRYESVWTGPGTVGASTGITIHDTGECQSDYPAGTFIENITIEDSYFTALGASGVYYGENYVDVGCPGNGYAVHNKGGIVRNNYFNFMGGGAIRVKVGYQAGFPYEVYGNTAIDVGNDTDTSGFQNGLLCLASGCNVYNNWVEDAGEHGIQVRTQRLPAATVPSVTANLYNNVIIDAGSNPNFSGDHGISVSRQDASDTNIIAAAYQNTIVDSESDGIEFATITGVGSRIEGNVVCNSGSNNIQDLTGNADQSDGNSTGTCASQNFVDYANDDLKLTGSSPGLDAATAGPATDIEGTARPQGANYNDGAYENN